MPVWILIILQGVVTVASELINRAMERPDWDRREKRDERRINQEGERFVLKKLKDEKRKRQARKPGNLGTK